MRKFLLLAFLVVIFVAVKSETLENAKLRGLSKKMSAESVFLAMRDTQFGKNLIELLTMRLHTNQEDMAPLLKILQDLEDEIKAQQSGEDQEYSKSSGIYQDIINAQAKILEETKKNIDELTTTISESKNTVRQKEDSEGLLNQERQQITDFLAQLQTTREADKQAYTKRAKNTELLIAGLQKTLGLFRESKANKELDQDSVANLISLLENIKASLDASSANDVEAESNAEKQYNSFVKNRSDRIKLIDSDLATLAAEVHALNASVKQLSTNLEAEEVRNHNAEGLKKQNEAALAQLVARYNSNKSTRSEQVRLLVLTKEKLTQSPQEAKDALF